MTATHDFLENIRSLKTGDRGRLRALANKPLDRSLNGFDLFAGLWWPLRQKSQFAPRREVAWLVAKLFSFCPLDQENGATVARQLGRLSDNARLRQQFDDLLGLPLSQLEVPLQQFLRMLARRSLSVDWIRLTDDLSQWENRETRLQWAKEFLERNSQC